MDQKNSLEKKINVLIGLGAVLVLLLGVVSYKMFFSAGVSNSDVADARNALGGGNTASVNAINPTTDPANTVPQVDPATATKMEFMESSFDFGTIKAGEKVTHLYKFKNTGDKPLTISNAKGSCGCTVPQWPKEPIAPGETGEIKVEFDSKGKSGKNTKTVTLEANTIPAQTTLTITGEVIAEEAAAEKKSK